MTEKQNAPATTGAPQPSGAANRPNSQKEYSTESIIKAKDLLLSAFPGDARQALENAINREVTRLLGNPDIDGNVIHSLLPTLPVQKASVILGQELPPIKWMVEDYLSPGLCFLYAKPKVGKSWLFYQLAHAVIRGDLFLGKRVQSGKVLYLALEDTDRRFQTRLKKQGWTNREAEQLDILKYRDFKKHIGTLNGPGGKSLMAFIDKQGYKLICIDTYSRAVKGEQLKVDEVTEAISELQQFALERDIYLIIIDHESKFGDTPFGSIAKLAVLDVAWRMFKEKGVGTKIQIEGRDLENEYLLKLRFDKEIGIWESLGNANEFEMTEKRQKITEIVKSLINCTASEINNAIQGDLSNTLKILNELVSEGVLKREGRNYSEK